ncbi:MAG TPA: hypothetical protein O0X14_03480, partial [Methanocorpusculum sp.]|nr:hypothetical protein [Methanocorpusculum sp.]
HNDSNNQLEVVNNNTSTTMPNEGQTSTEESPISYPIDVLVIILLVLAILVVLHLIRKENR